MRLRFPCRRSLIPLVNPSLLCLLRRNGTDIDSKTAIHMCVCISLHKDDYMITHLNKPVLVVYVVCGSRHVALSPLNPLITLDDPWSRHRAQRLQRLPGHLLAGVTRMCRCGFPDRRAVYLLRDRVRGRYTAVSGQFFFIKWTNIQCLHAKFLQGFHLKRVREREISFQAMIKILPVQMWNENVITILFMSYIHDVYVRLLMRVASLYTIAI